MRLFGWTREPKEPDEAAKLRARVEELERVGVEPQAAVSTKSAAVDKDWRESLQRTVYAEPAQRYEVASLAVQLMPEVRGQAVTIPAGSRFVPSSVAPADSQTQRAAVEVALDFAEVLVFKSMERANHAMKRTDAINAKAAKDEEARRLAGLNKAAGLEEEDESG